MTTTQTDALMALADRYAFHIPGSQHSDEARAVLLAALQEQAPNPWKEAVLDQLAFHAMDAPINMPPADILKRIIDVSVTMATDPAITQQPVQAREGEAVANSAILARGRFHFFKGEDGEPDDWEWFEEGTNCEHGCIDAVIVRADAIAAPQPAQPVDLPLDTKRLFSEWYDSLPYGEPSYQETFEAGFKAGIGGKL